MKIFLLKSLLFFGSILLGLYGIYQLLDPEQSTSGDVRYVKTQNVKSEKNKYDALLIGSSRVHDIGNTSECNYNIYNFGIIQGMPSDFPAFIKFTKQNQPLKKIIVGLDFEGSSTKGLNDVRASWKPSEYYISEVENESGWKQFKSIYDFPRFKRLVNYKILKNNPFERSKKVEHNSKKETSKQWNKVFWSIYENAYSNYSFNEKLPTIFQQIKESAGDAELVVYITPLSEPLFQLMVDKGLEDEYRQFLKSAVQSFGTVYNFMELNEFTTSPANFKDENHLTNSKLLDVVCQLTASGSERQIPMTKLSSENIDQYIDNKSYLKH